jgi:hypothetical protein
MGLTNGPFWKVAVSVSAESLPRGDSDADLPDWAWGQARSQLVQGDDAAIEERARQLVHDFDDERHGEDDDPDRGGEG